jgi:Cu(I)/Ag(I) efflux system membrane fusion protein
LLKASRRRLELLDAGGAIKRLEQGGEPLRTLTFSSPIEGVVTKKEVVDGMKLDAGAMPYEIVDLSKVWVLADIYESDVHRVRVGMTGRLTLKAYPNRAFEGVSTFIDPVLDPMTRTVKMRLEFANPSGELKPGKPREVVLGESDRGSVEVVSGLTEGENVVVRANFLVDSESQLRASLAALMAAKPDGPEAPMPSAPPSDAASPSAPPSPTSSHSPPATNATSEHATSAHATHTPRPHTPRPHTPRPPRHRRLRQSCTRVRCTPK